MSQINLWGDLPEIQNLSSPKRLLQEQADNLTSLTNGTIKGVVDTKTQGDQIINELVILAPFINNYRVGILQTQHGAHIYPVHVNNLVDERDWEAKECKDYEIFVSVVARILQSSPVRSIVTSLLIQSKEET